MFDTAVASSRNAIRDLLLASLLSASLDAAIDWTRIFRSVDVGDMEMRGTDASDVSRIVTTDSSRLTLTDT